MGKKQKHWKFSKPKIFESRIGRSVYILWKKRIKNKNRQLKRMLCLVHFIICAFERSGTDTDLPTLIFWISIRRRTLNENIFDDHLFPIIQYSDTIFWVLFILFRCYFYILSYLSQQSSFYSDRSWFSFFVSKTHACQMFWALGVSFL